MTIRKRSMSAKSETSFLSRDEVLHRLSAVIDVHAKRLQSGRIKDKDAFSQKIRALRALSYASGVYFAGLRDLEMSEILKKLDELEKQNVKR